jgi:hypothetical protein
MSGEPAKKAAAKKGTAKKAAAKKGTAKKGTAKKGTGSTGPPEEAGCPILDLQLGPLDLDLLGLRVQLSQVDLNITAEPGPGNLLGNLLCAVVSLLDGVDLSGILGDLLLQLLDALIGLIEGLGGGTGDAEAEPA